MRCCQIIGAGRGRVGDEIRLLIATHTHGTVMPAYAGEEPPKMHAFFEHVVQDRICWSEDYSFYARS